jgi:hypothetical protein
MENRSESKIQIGDIDDVRGILQGLTKAKKILNMYPSNNPIYIKTFNEIYNKVNKFLDANNDLLLKINQNDILFNDEQVYHATEKDDNLALIFFKDGVRELTLLKGLSESEFSDLIKIINTDFENFELEDDIVTLFWERDFDHIRYLVTEEFLYDEEDEKVYEKAKVKSQTDENLTRAYHEGLKASETKLITPIPINYADYQHLAEDIKQAETTPKIEKLITILYELLYLTKEERHFTEVVSHIKNLMIYGVKEGIFQTIVSMLDSIKLLSEDKDISEDKRKLLKNLYRSVNGIAFIREIGWALESEKTVHEKDFLECIKHFNSTSIPSFIQLLGELQQIRSRRLLIETLAVIGRLDIKKLGEGLNDNRWFVAKNIVIVLGKIADSWSRELLIKALTHKEERVRKEVIKSLASMGGSDLLPHLKTALDDNVQSIRITAARAIGNIKTDSAKKVLLDELSRKDFLAKEFAEKKEFYTAISNWKDSEVMNFLLRKLKKKKIFKRARHDETRACAAFILGVVGNKEAIPVLEKTKNSKNKLLRSFSNNAINQLTK